MYFLTQIVEHARQIHCQRFYYLDFPIYTLCYGNNDFSQISIGKMNIVEAYFVSN